MSFFVTPYVDEYGDTTYNLTAAGYTGLVLLLIVLLLAGCAIFGGKKKMNARQLVFSAMAITLATVTSMIKLFDMPMGGSVTLLSMLFIVLVGYWYGLGGGLTAAFAYGILQLIIDPYILSLPRCWWITCSPSELWDSPVCSRTRNMVSSKDISPVSSDAISSRSSPDGFSSAPTRRKTSPTRWYTPWPTTEPTWLRKQSSH